MKPFMEELISPWQSTFISGRNIADNILLCHDLFKGFHLDKGKPRMCLKLNNNKAFDSVRWDFVEAALKALNSPSSMIGWIMECIGNPAFSILVNRKA